MGYISKKVAAYGQFVLVFFNTRKAVLPSVIVKIAIRIWHLKNHYPDTLLYLIFYKF